MAAKRKPISLALEDGLVELRKGDAEPRWIWVETCALLDCDCRVAVIVVSRSGGESLLAAASGVKTHLAQEDDPDGYEPQLADGCAVFGLDIDTGEVLPFGKDGQSPLQRTSWLGEIVDRIDGGVLDGIARLWHRGKGQEDPELAPRDPREVSDWRPGDEVSWEEAYWGLRDDVYPIDERLYEVKEFYCVTPECDCARVLLRVVELADGQDDDQDRLVGTMSVEKTGVCTMETDDGTREELEKTWAAYQNRYPEFRERHASRGLRMKAFGALLLKHHEAKSLARTAPNDPCPCGSGKKFKKCCWKKLIAGGS